MGEQEAIQRMTDDGTGLLLKPAEHRKMNEAHDPADGRFSSGGGSSNQDRSTGGQRPVSQTYIDPPPPRGQAGRAAGGFSAAGMTNTALGDLAEHVTKKFQMKSLLKGVRQGPLDRVYDGTNHAYEVKCVSTDSTEYKCRMKASEVARKIAYTKIHKLSPNMMMVVFDRKTKEAHVYTHEGIGNFRLNKEWAFLGKVKMDASGKAVDA